MSKRRGKVITQDQDYGRLRVWTAGSSLQRKLKSDPGKLEGCSMYACGAVFRGPHTETPLRNLFQAVEQRRLLYCPVHDFQGPTLNVRVNQQSCRSIWRSTTRGEFFIHAPRQDHVQNAVETLTQGSVSSPALRQFTWRAVADPQSPEDGK